jgi:manganese/zinc/iron transport system substrate-binding protein
MVMTRCGTWWVWVLGGLCAVAGCDPGAGPGPEVADGRLGIVATTAMIGDAASRIGGEHVRVTTLIGEGVDPHLYQPTAGDVKALRAADLVLVNGLMLEGKMGDLLERMKRAGKAVHAAADALEGGDGSLLADEGGHPDPHVWMDVASWRRVVRGIAAALGGADEAHAAVYEANLEAYDRELADLEAYARETLATVPEGQRVLVTAHDAFGYFGKAYGLEVRGIQGLSTESEAGVRDIEALVAFLVERKIPAVFVETSVSEDNVKALIEGARARGHEVRIGGELYSDAMGAAGSHEGTYVGMIDHNVTVVTRALGGNAPEKGKDGKLR